jgi:hypothetical protein
VIRYYLGLRRNVSLLLSEGHTEAHIYPISVVWSEVNIVRQRNASRRLRDSTVTQHVLSSLFSKDANKALRKLLNKVDDSD